jgi:hypothetical protein
MRKRKRGDALARRLLVVRSEHPTRELGDFRLNGRSRSALLVARHDRHSVRVHVESRSGPNTQEGTRWTTGCVAGPQSHRLGR